MPPKPDDEDFRDLEPSRDISRLLEIMVRLRDPDNGCAWDLKQTYASVAPFTIEEAYEVRDAINRNDMPDFCEELGDLLLQVVYQAQIARELEDFDFGDVVHAITKKMIRRHPHVFGSEEQKKNGMAPGTWERIKAEEKREKALARKQEDRGLDAPQSGFLDDVPSSFPSLIEAQKLQKRASEVGFDWDDIDQVLEKLKEECTELAAEREGNDRERIKDEMGDVLFVAVNLARHLNVDAESALQSTNQKFRRRFAHIERSLFDKGKSLDEATLMEMEQIWQESKKQIKSKGCIN